MSIPSFTQFATGQILTAVTLNQFPTAAVSSFGNIDRTNMGPNGIDASSIKPTTTPAATFGGTIAYNFPASVAAFGVLSAPLINSVNTQGHCPPAYSAAGATLGSTAHLVQGTFAGTGGAVTITLVGAAAFTSSTSYTMWCWDTTAGTAALNTTQNAGSIVFAGTTNLHTYVYLAFGT